MRSRNELIPDSAESGPRRRLRGKCAFLLCTVRPEPIIICAAFLFIRNAAFFVSAVAVKIQIGMDELFFHFFIGGRQLHALLPYEHVLAPQPEIYCFGRDPFSEEKVQIGICIAASFGIKFMYIYAVIHVEQPGVKT